MFSNIMPPCFGQEWTSSFHLPTCCMTPLLKSFLCLSSFGRMDCNLGSKRYEVTERVLFWGQEMLCGCPPTFLKSCILGQVLILDTHLGYGASEQVPALRPWLLGTWPCPNYLTYSLKYLSPCSLCVWVLLDCWLPLSTIFRHSLSHMDAMGWCLLSLMSLMSLSPSSTPLLHGGPCFLFPCFSSGYCDFLFFFFNFWCVFKNIKLKHDVIGIYNKEKAINYNSCKILLPLSAFAICTDILNYIPSGPLYLFIFHHKINKS